MLAVHNGPVEEMLGGAGSVPKLSDGDGRIHVVYSGLDLEDAGGSRDIAPLLDCLLDEDALVVHVIGAAGKEVPDVAPAVGEGSTSGSSSSRRWRAGTWCASLARFDVGLVYVGEAFQRGSGTRCARTSSTSTSRPGCRSSPNRGRALEEYLCAKQAGVVFDRLAEVSTAVREALELSRRAGWPPPVETYEGQADRLDAFFREVLAGPASTPS